MTGFLTIEDVNGILFSNQEFWWHELDTALIDPLGEAEFSNLKVDFCTITKTSVSSDTAWQYTIIIDNSLWTTGVVILDKDDVFMDDPISVTGNTLKFTVMKSTNFAPCKFILYMGSLKLSSPRNLVNVLVDSELSLDLKELGLPQTLKYKDMNDNRIETITQNVVKGFNEINDGGNIIGYLFVSLLKTDFQFNCTQTLTVGKVNKVSLGALADYKPNGALVGSYTPQITVQYNGETLPVSFDGTDYYFNLDLTDKTETGKVRFTVNVESNEVLNSTSTDVALNSQYQTVNTFNALLTAVTNSDVIRLGANMTATANIPINKSIKIIGNDKTIDLDSHRFVLVEDVQLTIENTRLDNGDTTIIQAKNTIVNLTGVIFNNCTSSNYNGLGACIFCDVDVDSLDVTNDYIATLTECTFTDNANCILHGGELTIQKCTMDNDSITNININNPAFVYQTDGQCLIQQSTFNINYDYTSAETNIGYAQALIMCGETANINGATHTDLQTDNSLPFFDAPFNNRANLHAKYYYPQIEDNVESITQITDKGCCHSVSNKDWVYKDNVQVRRSE